jgi:PPK2 family polyphosphate:nucleotide phosphotransferase
MKIDYKRFKIQGNCKLKDLPTQVDSLYTSKQHYQNILENYIEKMSDQQSLLYANSRYSLLLIFQGMDTSGKDGLIKHVMSGINPQGCQTFSFKQPSTEELQHDFLWRASTRLPERGRIGIFNRSYYEDVLIVKVHPELLQNQMLPETLLNEKSIWKQRYHSIMEFEKHLFQNGTRIIKFFLHLSKEEQRARFLKRIDKPEKNWKFSISDIEERKFWSKYMDAYEECLTTTSTATSPWYAIPADDKENARLIIGQIILDTLIKLKLDYPEVSKKRRKELEKIRELL